MHPTNYKKKKVSCHNYTANTLFLQYQPNLRQNNTSCFNMPYRTRMKRRLEIIYDLKGDVKYPTCLLYTSRCV